MATITTDKPVRNAKTTLVLNITPEHCKRAECKNPSKCVIAQAVRDSPLGEVALEMEVCSSCTKIVLGDVILRYKTPAKLRHALHTFDQTDLWSLPPGEYKLHPYTAAQRRWESARRLGGVQSKFGGGGRVISAPTRVSRSIQQLRSITEGRTERH